MVDWRGRDRRTGPRAAGFTLVELATALAVMAVALAIALPSVQNYRTRVKNDRARQDIMVMAAGIERFWQDARRYPTTLAEAGYVTPIDPWGNPYRYLSMDEPASRGQARKDHSLVPINTDFDLYSMGPDGRSSPPLTARHSRDDIVRANNGAYVGPASEY